MRNVYSQSCASNGVWKITNPRIYRCKVSAHMPKSSTRSQIIDPFHTNVFFRFPFKVSIAISKHIPNKRNQLSPPTQQRIPAKRTLCLARDICHVVDRNRCPPHRWAHPNQCAKLNRIRTLPDNLRRATAPLTHSEHHRSPAVGFCPVCWAFNVTLPHRPVPLCRTLAKRPKKRLTSVPQWLVRLLLPPATITVRPPIS